jgi:hypothetical protein
MTRLARLFVTSSWNGRDTFRWFDGSGIAELDFWCPDRTSDVDPIVVRCALERLSGVDWSIELFLSLPVLLHRLARLLNFELLSFTIFVRHLLLVVCELRLLYELMLCVFDRA